METPIDLISGTIESKGVSVHDFTNPQSPICVITADGGCKISFGVNNESAEAIGKNEKVCSDTITQPGNCRIFGMSSGSPSGYGSFVGSVYSFKVYETETGKTLYNLVPGRNADGEACFVDSLTGKTYENKGTGRFILDESAVSTSAVMPPLKRQGLIIFIN